MLYIYATGLVVLNTLWLAIVPLGLPGAWLMIAGAGLMAWWQWEADMFSIWTLAAAAVLAAFGELLEFLASAQGALKGGGTRYGALGALIGAIVGAILFTGLVPIPVLGTIIGVCLGAFCGAGTMELLSGRQLHESIRSGQGAAVGRFWGTIYKLIIAAIIWAILALAAFV